MKQRVWVTAILITLCATLVHADDLTGKPRAAANKPVLFINTNISPFGLVATNETYREFANIARSMGFVADHGWLTELNKEFLDSIDVLVLSIPALTLLDEDKENLRAFIKDGGGVWILGYGFFNQDLSNLDSFIRNYGITFANATFGATNGNVIAGSILSGPEKATIIRSPYTRVGLTVDNSKAAAQAMLDNGQVLVAISTDKKLLSGGKLVVHGDASMLAKEYAISEIDMQDNRNFAKNILSYFLSKYDLKVLISKMKKKIAVAGRMTTAVARIKNIGTTDSEKVKVQFIISDGESSQGKPADDIAVLKTITIESIAPGQSIKISRKVRIPSGVEPGDYYLITVVDPDGKSNDADSENNRKVGKMFTVM